MNIIKTFSFVRPNGKSFIIKKNDIISLSFYSMNIKNQTTKDKLEFVVVGFGTFNDEFCAILRPTALTIGVSVPEILSDAILTKGDSYFLIKMSHLTKYVELGIIEIDFIGICAEVLEQTVNDKNTLYFNPYLKQFNLKHDISPLVIILNGMNGIETKEDNRRYRTAPRERGFSHWHIPFRCQYTKFGTISLGIIASLTVDFSGEVIITTHNTRKGEEIKSSRSLYYEMSGINATPKAVSEHLLKIIGR